MISFIIDHPYLSFAAVVWLIIVILGWLFIAGAAIASRRCDE